MRHPDAEGEQLRQERYQLLQQLTDWLETPLLVLGFGWLVLLGVELVWGLTPALELLGTGIWVIFILDFLLKFALAPRKWAFLKSNLITLISLLVPALRLFRLARVFRAARAVRGLRLVKVVGSLNRGMKALAASFGRRGVGYVLGLSALVLLVGAAGMYAFEKDVPGGLRTYPEALWWTAMLLTSLGSEYWPCTGEGRALCLLLALYGFAVFGYFTTTLATFFMGRDAENPRAEVVGAAAVAALHEEVRQLRAELGEHQKVWGSLSTRLSEIGSQLFKFQFRTRTWKPPLARPRRRHLLRIDTIHLKHLRPCRRNPSTSITSNPCCPAR